MKTHIDLFSGIIQDQVHSVNSAFYCQDVSNAGKRMGITGKRSGLWQEMVRIIKESQVKWCLIENVSFLVANGLRRVLSDLDEIGYHAQWNCISAAHIGAPHIRDRVWIIAYPKSLSIDKSMEIRRILVDGWNKKVRCESWIELIVGDNEVAPSKWRITGQNNTRPLLIRNDDGVSSWVDRHRLGSLGNAIVPQIAFEIMKAILKTEELYDQNM